MVTITAPFGRCLVSRTAGVAGGTVPALRFRPGWLLVEFQRVQPDRKGCGDDSFRPRFRSRQRFPGARWRYSHSGWHEGLRRSRPCFDQRRIDTISLRRQHLPKHQLRGRNPEEMPAPSLEGRRLIGNGSASRVPFVTVDTFDVPNARTSFPA